MPSLLTLAGLCNSLTLCSASTVFPLSAVFPLCCAPLYLDFAGRGNLKSELREIICAPPPRLWQLEICSTFTFKIIFPSFFSNAFSPWKSMFHFPPMNICFDWICLSSRFVLKSVCRQDTHPKFWRSDTSVPICHETASWWNCKLNLTKISLSLNLAFGVWISIWGNNSILLLCTDFALSLVEIVSLLKMF